MALKRTTTPALTTQVISVGEMVKSSTLARCFFRTSRLSRDDDLRLPLPWIKGEAGEFDDVADELRRSGGGLAGLDVPGRADSGIMRMEEGSTRLLGPACAQGCDNVCSRFGRPRAAAAHERRVERLARRAASWSVV